MRALLSHHWRRHGAVLAALALGLFAFEFLLTRVAPEPNEVQAFQGILNLLPAPLLNMMGSEFTANFSARGMIAFGYAHPFTIVMMSAWAVRLTATALAGEIGAGTMDLIAAKPVPRSLLVSSALAALGAGLLIIVVTGWLGTAIGVLTRPALALAPWPYLKVALVCWLLFAAVGAIGLCVSAVRRQGGPAIAITAGFIAVSFAWNFVARSWKPLASTQRLSLFMYYSPVQIYRAVPGRDVLVLLAVAAVFAAASFGVFAKRDL